MKTNNVTAQSSASAASIIALDYRPRKGLSVPSVTVLDETGRVIEDEQRAVFRFNAQQGFGADIIFAAGTNGEWNRISNTERQRLIRLAAGEVARINHEIRAAGRKPVEAWAGVTSPSRLETLCNLECAVECAADAAVIAPLSIADLDDLVGFFQREVSDLFDRLGKSLPIFLYDNADIAVNPKTPHIHTRDVKRLSRLEFISGLKVSAPRRVLGNYTKGALHYKERGEFGVYVGDAMLMFQVFRMEDGFIGRIKEYWNRYLLHNEVPVGVVSGPGNALPREWQRAWRACYSGDENLAFIYQRAFEQFAEACVFESNGNRVNKSIACLKQALKLQGVITSTRVATGTDQLSAEEEQEFARRFAAIKKRLQESTSEPWISR